MSRGCSCFACLLEAGEYLYQADAENVLAGWSYISDDDVKYIVETIKHAIA